MKSFCLFWVATFAWDFGPASLFAQTETMPSTPAVEEKVIETKSGLKYVDLVEGSGPAVTPGKKVTVHYVGRLENGKIFDESRSRGKPFSFVQGVTHLIPGWTEGTSTMKEGGKRRLYIPARLGYGESGAGDAIPPQSDLIFEIEVLNVE